MSVMSRSDGVGGKMCVPRAMYSFSTSFWIVPVSLSAATPCLAPTAMYIANSTAAGALIVIDVDTLSSGIESKRISMSASVSIATPTLPISPAASGSSLS